MYFLNELFEYNIDDDNFTRKFISEMKKLNKQVARKAKTASPEKVKLAYERVKNVQYYLKEEEYKKAIKAYRKLVTSPKTGHVLKSRSASDWMKTGGAFLLGFGIIISEPFIRLTSRMSQTSTLETNDEFREQFTAQIDDLVKILAGIMKDKGIKNESIFFDSFDFYDF